MSNGLNKCLFIGNCGKDPETGYTPSGSAVTNISIGVGESWKDKATGQKQEKTEWVNVVFYNKLAEIAGEYLRKGSQVYIEGKMKTRKWQDKEGNDRYTTEIVANEMKMLGGRPAPAQDQHNQDKSNGYAPEPAEPTGGDPFSDDIPF